MPRKPVLFLNPNRMKPPIAPIGLEYVAEATVRAGYECRLCDLAFAEDWQAALSSALSEDLLAVAVSVRNIDDAYFASQDFILDKTRSVIRHVKAACGAPVVLGGVGFSVAPAEILEFTEADFGITGDGEEAFPAMLRRLENGQSFDCVPGAVYREDEAIRVVPPQPVDLAIAPAFSRDICDHRRYFAQGGQAGVETKRGCDRHCIYCVDPVAKGQSLRLRRAEDVAGEFRALLDQGVNVIHLCDSEFNVPYTHAQGVCEALIATGLANKIAWYTYAAPAPFDTPLARLMKRAGCVGIDFGVDHAVPAMLARLGQSYGPDEIRATAEACRQAGVLFMFDMLLGTPGETRDSIHRAIDLMRETRPDRVGLSCGVRVYPHTPLAKRIRSQGPLDANPNLHGTTANNDDLLRPIFYVEEGIGEDIHRFVWSLVGGDKRFLAANPAETGQDYNYNENSTLSEAIRAGARGAYWDILRRLDGETA